MPKKPAQQAMAGVPGAADQAQRPLFGDCYSSQAKQITPKGVTDFGHMESYVLIVPTLHPFFGGCTPILSHTWHGGMQLDQRRR